MPEGKLKKNKPLPSVEERLAHLRPSRELLEFYRKKVEALDGEHEEMLERLENYRSTYQEQHRQSWELRQREDEIVELQKALSDMQVYLFQEREHVLRLYSENDRLKIRELEDRKKIHHLLSLCGRSESEVTYFLKQPPALPVVEKQLHVDKQAEPDREGGSQISKNQTIGRNKSGKTSSVICKDEIEEENKRLRDSNQLLLLQIESLQSQLVEAAKLYKEQLESMTEDKRVRQEEIEAVRSRDNEKMNLLTDRLNKAQELLFQSTRDFFSLRKEHRVQEKQWIQEKDRILKSMDDLVQVKRDFKDSTLSSIEVESNTEERQAQVDVESLRWQLEQAQKMTDMYREQVLALEERVAHRQEETDYHRKSFKERASKMTKRVELANARYAELENRRKLENEGFRNDLKILRGRLKEMEAQLHKLTILPPENISASTRPQDIDLVVLRDMYRTTGRSKKMMEDLGLLKAKLYGLENDLRHL